MTGKDSPQCSERDSDVFEIPWRPKRIVYDTEPVYNSDGTRATDENGDPVVTGGGSTIEGYTQFSLTEPSFNREETADTLGTASEWGPYMLSEWEPYNQLVYDLEEDCPFEVRILDDRVIIDVKSATTTTSTKSFVTRFETELGVTWEVTRQSERIAP